MDAVVIAHVARRLDPNPDSRRPLFIAIQGPQGSGKSYLSAQLKKQLSEPPHSLNVAVLSIDDLYLPHDELIALAAQAPPNPLWTGRGQPGTHDVDLGIAILRTLRSQKDSVELPIFDKSLFGGEGDRLPRGSVVHPPIDVIILEGWCVGFCPVSEDELDERWDNAWKEECRKLALPDSLEKRDLQRVNESLKRYTELWSFFDLFVQIKPAPVENDSSDYSIIYRWRLEQERNMKMTNGGRGMTDRAVKSFVDRYIPGYVFFGELRPSSFPQAPPVGQNLRLYLAEDRQLVKTENF